MPSTDTIRVHVPLSLRKRGGRPRIQDVITVGTELMVQATKEEAGNKGADAALCAIELCSVYQQLAAGGA